MNKEKIRTIYKYGLSADDYNYIEMPKGAEILTVKLQGGYPCLWVLVDPNEKKEIRIFRTAGTGHWIKENNVEYIDTFLIENDHLVFHVFEIKDTPT